MPLVTMRAKVEPASTSTGTYTSQAAVALGPMETEIRNLAVPDIGRDDGLLRVEASGVCGTDWAIYRRDGVGASLGALVLGHETVGRILAIGDRAAARWEVDVGDRVAVEEYIPCRQCSTCRAGDFRACSQADLWAPEPRRYGCTPLSVAPALWGGFSEVQYLHRNSILHRVSPGVPAEVATLFVPLANGIRWLDQAAVPQSGCVVVVGPGQHGLGCVVAAREAGIRTIVVVGLPHDARRLAAAKALGATLIIEAGATPLAEVIQDVTDGRLADSVIDVSSGAQTIGEAIEATRRGGAVVVAGLKSAAPAALSSDDLVRKELRLIGVRGHDVASVRRAIEIIESGRYSLANLCTHAFDLADVDRGLRMVGERLDPDAIHVSVLPNKEVSSG
jgi:threonine dehydrogenase-like Zn-dependent dehydrogenase